MKLKIFNSNQIKFADIVSAINQWLVETYDQSKEVFTKASPFGQILSVIQAFSQLVFLYIEDVVVESNIFTATKQRSIYGLARLAGHNPTRALSAQGTISLKIKPGAETPINASYLILLNKTRLSCISNNRNYFIQLGDLTNSLRINLKSNEVNSVKIIQGELESQTATSTGTALQSFSFRSKMPIENEMVWVYVNGEAYENVDSLYDMRKGEKQCMVKTGISGGIDVYFGNEDFGVIPAEGAIIKVEYVKTDGFSGNIFSKSSTLEWRFLDSAFSNTGEEVDLNEILFVTVEKPIILGADDEPMDLTKLIAPKTSRSYVLANPDNYVNFLSRFNYSYVDAYTTRNDDYISDDNVVYLFIIPNIKRRLESNSDYFTTNLINFYLDEDEKAALIDFIDMSGQQIISTELQIVDPILTKYVLNIYLRIYDTVDQSTLKSEVIAKITDYFLSVTRRDKIPKSDLIALIEGIKGVDSVNLSFVSEANEKAILDGYYIQRINTIDRIRGISVVQENQIMINPGDDPNIGLDEFGDIKIGLNEQPVIRGDWYDRFGNYFEDGISQTSFSSLNIVVKDVVKETTSIRMMNANKDSIR